MVVLSVQQEVGPNNGHAHRHNCQDDEHQQHEAVHIVDLREAPTPGSGFTYSELLGPAELCTAASALRDLPLVHCEVEQAAQHCFRSPAGMSV